MALQAKTIPIPKHLKKYDSARDIKQTFVSWTNVRVAPEPALPVECAPGAGQVEVSDLTGVLGFRKMKAMARQQRSHSIEFKRQVVQEYIAGETLYGLAKRHDLSSQQRMVGRQAMEIEFLKGALKNAPRPRSATTSVIAGPTASPSQKDAG
jgi:hypothetical protein